MGRTGSDGGGCFGVKVLFLLFQLVEQRLYLEEFVLHGADFAMAFFGVQLGLDMVLLLFGPFVLKVVELRHFLSGGTGQGGEMPLVFRPQNSAAEE
jgi:hypothetical protein